MPILTVRISEEEKKLLASRAKASGVSAGALVRELINNTSFVTGEDILRDFKTRMGDTRLRIKRKS